MIVRVRRSGSKRPVTKKSCPVALSMANLAGVRSFGVEGEQREHLRSQPNDHQLGKLRRRRRPRKESRNEKLVRNNVSSLTRTAGPDHSRRMAMNWWKPDNWTFDGIKSSVAIVVGIGALIGFVWLVQFMLGQITSEEKQWTRAVYVFGGVEALAFSAAGFFFGSQVHRERAEKAEQRAGKAQQDAANGKALAEVVKGKAKGLAEKTGRMKPSGGTQTAESPDESLTELASLANRYFP
jgi:hypothetical protein